jgi:hypothetical protein
MINSRLHKVKRCVIVLRRGKTPVFRQGMKAHVCIKTVGASTVYPSERKTKVRLRTRADDRSSRL